VGCLIHPGISRVGGNNRLWPTLLKHERYGWGEVQISSTRNKWIPWLTSHVGGNTKLALADKCNRYKLKPIILQLPLTDHGDLLKMWQYAASLSHSPQMTAHVVKTQVLSVVCCNVPTTFLLWKWQLQQQESHTHTYQAPKHLISDYHYLMTGGIMQTYSRHQATCQLLALTSSGHTAHAPARGLFQKLPQGLRQCSCHKR